MENNSAYDPNSELPNQELSPLPTDTQPNPEIIPKMSRGEAAGVSAQQGLTFGYGPEGEAYRRALDEMKKRGEIGEPQFPAMPFPGAPPVILPLATDEEGRFKDVLQSQYYKDFLEEERARVRGAREQYPYTSFASELGGSLVNPATVVAPELKAGQFFTNIARRGIPAAAQVSAYNEPKKPYEKSDTALDTLEKAGEGFIAGNLLGPVLGKAISAGAATGQQLLEAASRLRVAGVPIGDIPRYLTTDSSVAKWLSESLAKTPIAREPLNKIPEDYRAGLEATRTGITEGIDPSLVGQTFNEAGKKVQSDIGAWVEGQKKNFSDQYTQNLANVIDDTKFTSMTNTGNAVSDIIQRKANIGAGSFNFNDPRDVRKATSGAVQHVIDALQDPSGKNFSQLKELRTYLREIAGNPANNISKKEYDLLYKGISDDMEEAAKLSGNVNYNEYKRIDADYKKNLDAISDFQNFFGNFEKRGNQYVFDKTPEQLIGQISDAMKSGKGGSYDKLTMMMNSLSPEGRNSARNIIVSSLGSKPSAAAPDVIEFDPEKFIKQYGSLNKEAKELVFGPELKRSLDDLSTLSSPYSGGSASPMGKIKAPGESASQLGEIKVGAALGTVFWAGVGGLMGGRITSNYLANPSFAQRTGSLAKAYTALSDNPVSEAAQKAFVSALKQMPITAAQRLSADDYFRLFGVAKNTAENLRKWWDQTPEPQSEGKSSGGRIARKSGGRTGGNSISAEVKRVRALLSEKTASMLSVPDDAIATALHIAKRT
jgi:hypothetical protein